MMAMSLARLAIAAASLAFAAGVAAAGDDEPIRTVYWDHAQITHGEPFEVECERGSYLVGFDGRAGAWIDQLRLVCARWNVVSGKLEPPVVLEERRLGWLQGGEPTHAECPAGTGIAGIYDEHYARNDSAYVLHTLEFNCEGATDGMRPRWREFGSTSSIATGWKDPQPHAGCPAGYLATGIYGRSGEFIDKLFGWVCRRRPVESPFVGAKVNDAAKAKANNSKWVVGGTSRVGNDLVVASGSAAPNTPPPSPSTPPPPPPANPNEMARVRQDTDVYRLTAKGDFVRLGTEDDFLEEDFKAPVLVKNGGWWKLALKNIAFVPGGEGWVAANDLELLPKQ